MTGHGHTLVLAHELLSAFAPRSGARVHEAAAHRKRGCCRMQQHAREAGGSPAEAAPHRHRTRELLRQGALSASLHGGVRPAWHTGHVEPARVTTTALPARAGSRALGRGHQVQQPLADVLLQCL